MTTEHELIAEDFRKAAQWNAGQGNFEASTEYVKLYRKYAYMDELDIPIDVEFEKQLPDTSGR